MLSGWCFNTGILLWAASFLAAAEAPERVYQQALRSFSEQRYEDAERLAGQLVRQRPRWFEARFLLGASLVSQGRSAAAVEQLEAARRLNPIHLDCVKLLASEYIALERASEALTSLRPFLAGKQPDEELHLLAIEALYLRGDANDVEEALQLSDRGLKRYPRSARMLTWRGYALRERGSLPEARQSLEGALKLVPDDMTARALLADVIRREGGYDQALRLFDQVLAEVPADEEAVVGKSRTLVAMGKTAEALEMVSAAVRAAPDLPRLRVELSQLYARTGDSDAAAREAAEFRRLRGSQKERTIPAGLHTPRGGQ